jgi:hypothetical protein
MSSVKRTGEALNILLSGGALFGGLLLLATAPISGVLVILGAMGLMLISAARFCGLETPTQERQTVTQYEKSLNEGSK